MVLPLAKPWTLVKHGTQLSCKHIADPLLPAAWCSHACLILRRSCYEVACDSLKIQDNYGAKLVSLAHGCSTVHSCAGMITHPIRIFLSVKKAANC